MAMDPSLQNKQEDKRPRVLNSASPIVAGLNEQQTNVNSEINLSTDYESETERVESFAGWPLEHLVNAEQLARVGFVYTGKGSLVQCFQCGVRYRNWLEGDIPLNVHQKCNLNCVFLKTLSCKSEASLMKRPSMNKNASLKSLDYIDQTQLYSMSSLDKTYSLGKSDSKSSFSLDIRQPQSKEKCSHKPSILEFIINEALPPRSFIDNEPSGIIYPPSWVCSPPPINSPPSKSCHSEETGAPERTDSMISLNSMQTICEIDCTVYHDSLSVPEEEAILDTRVVSAEDNGHMYGALNAMPKGRGGSHPSYMPAERCHFSTTSPPPEGWDGHADQGCIIPPDFSDPQYPYPESNYQQKAVTDIIMLRHSHADMCMLTGPKLKNCSVEPEPVGNNVSVEDYVLGQCQICKDDIVKYSFIDCGHTACSECCKVITDSTRQCPYCRKAVLKSHRTYL